MASIHISGLEEVVGLLLEKGKPKAWLWFEEICGDIAQGFVLGSVFGTVFDFFKGMINAPKGKRLTGGVSYVEKNGVFHHGPVVAAHFGALTFFETVIPDNLKLLGAVAFGVVRFIRTKSLEAAGQSALAGFLLGFSLKKMHDL